MQEETLKDLVSKIQHFNCEFQTVEVKAAEGGCSKNFVAPCQAFRIKIVAELLFLD